jgi:hypothetical protein
MLSLSHTKKPKIKMKGIKNIEHYYYCYDTEAKIKNGDVCYHKEKNMVYVVSNAAAYQGLDVYKVILTNNPKYAFPDMKKKTKVEKLIIKK